MARTKSPEIYDYVIIGSGFGGAVSAMRLGEKGYRVLVLERGRRYEDGDLPRTNWNIWKFLWLPPLRCYGLMQISLIRGLMALRWAAVGGGSLGYANVLEVPSDRLFEVAAWKNLADWKTLLAPHYETARKMLGVVCNTHLREADTVLREISAEFGYGETSRPVNVGVFFGPEGQDVPDPYFGGEGPPRRGCNFCGACMVGCRYNGKNTLMKNYLYFAEKRGVKVRPEVEVTDIRPLPSGRSDGARYEVTFRRSTAWLLRPSFRVQARNVVVSAGVLGTLRLLLNCRDVTRSLPRLSPRLGDMVRTNSEALLGSIGRSRKVDWSKGIAITSIIHADEVTCIEPVRYPSGSSVMRFVTGPLMERENVPKALLKFGWFIIRHPMDFLREYLLPGWADRTTILLVMQTIDNHMRLKLGRGPLTLFRLGMVAEQNDAEKVPVRIDVAHKTARRFAEKTGGFPGGSAGETLLNTPFTAHILGGCPFGREASEGVVALDCQVHNYPGLYVVDGSIVPGNPGVNPSLTIAALAEYAMSHMPAKS